MSVIVETRSLTRELGAVVKTRALAGVDVAIHERQLVSLTGPSGSGKSTLLYLLGALDKPTGGQVLVDGVDIGALSEDQRAALRAEKIGFVFQFHFLLPEFSVLENVVLPMLRRDLRPKAECEESARSILARLGLGELTLRRPHQLSGGQQQRVAIARAIANEPRILLADEPTGNLDTANGILVMDLFERLVAEHGLTVVMVTHEPSFAARAARQISLRDGLVVSDVSRS